MIMTRSQFIKTRIFFVTGWLVAITLSAQNNPFSDLTVPASPEEQHWVDSVFQSLTPEERIGQLFMAAAYSNRGPEHTDALLKLIRQQHIGGLIFFQGTPERQAEMTNYFQSQSKVPLLIALDGEWGPGMRLDGTLRFPYQMTLGAIQNDSLIYDMGVEIAREFTRLGIQMNFAPVVDVNNNPHNPVINFRSFGTDRINVTRKGSLYMLGMQDHGILATAKHFPGHGDTDTDSHLGLPVIRHSRHHLDSLELFPFRTMIRHGVAAIMVAHLNIPSLDSTPNQASTLSKPIVTGLLKNKLGFKGIVVTDAMNMKGVADYYPPGIADVKALEAGNDLVEFSKDIPKAIKEVMLALKNGQLRQNDMDRRVKKILRAKYRAGLNHYQPVNLHNLRKDLNTPAARMLNRRLSQEAITLLKNQDSILPVRHLEKQKIAAVVVGSDTITRFQDYLKKYTRMDLFVVPADTAARKKMLNRLHNYSLVILGIQGFDQRPYRHFGLNTDEISLIDTIVRNHPAITVFFGNPYALGLIPGIKESKALLITYQETPVMEELAAQMVFGAYGIKGKLPVAVNGLFKMGDGIITTATGRLRYDAPEAVGMDSRLLEQTIDSIARTGIDSSAYPGCEILVARNGTVVFHKCYGYFTYARQSPVTPDVLYDLASVTKITGSLPALMRLHDQGKFKLDVPLSTYWPAFRHSNKKNVMIRDVLAHQGRLQSWIPYWRNTVNKHGDLRRIFYSLDSTDRYTYYVAPRIFLKKSYRKKIYKAIKKSPLLPEKKYLYSDLSFYLWPHIIENQTGIDYEAYVKDSVYRPLGAWDLTYNPYKHYPLSRIVPTENDTFFRKEQLQGWVHDEGAAMMGGVSGNAGLFGTANDLAKLMQMYLNMGTFGGRRIISDSTLREFSRYQFPDNGNRRGLGFDKPSLHNHEVSPEEAYPSLSASPESFGHSGYTGTFTWVDPAYGLLYIFFSNRVYPTRKNQKLINMNIRTIILEAVYESIKAKSKRQK